MTDPDEPGLDYSRLYEYRFRGVDQGARQAVWDEIAPFVWRRMGSPRRVLDPAGGRGEFVNAVPADEALARRRRRLHRTYDRPNAYAS